MADKWAQYAEPAAAPPQRVDKWAQYAEPPVDKPGYASQVGTGIWNAVKGLAEVGNAGFHLATDSNSPLTAMEHLRTLKRLIVDPQVDQAIQAADKWKAGDRSEAVGHALASIIPGAGPAAAGIGDKAGSGDFTGALADATVLGGAMALPHVLPKAAAVAGAAADTVKGVARVATDPAVVRAGVAILPKGNAVLKLVDAIKAARAPNEVPPVARPTSAPTAPPAVQPRTLLGPGPIITPPPADASFVRSVPAQVAPSVRPAAPTPPPFQPRGLIGAAPDVIIPPAPPDASFVRSVPAEYPQVEGAAAAATAAPAENMAALDGLAQSLNGTSFAKASPESQAMIRTLASRLDKPIPAELNTPPAATPRAPLAAPEPAAPSKSLQQMIQEELAAKRASAVPPPTEQPPAPATAQVPQAPPAAEVNPGEPPRTRIERFETKKEAAEYAAVLKQAGYDVGEITGDRGGKAGQYTTDKTKASYSFETSSPGEASMVAGAKLGKPKLTPIGGGKYAMRPPDAAELDLLKRQFPEEYGRIFERQPTPATAPVPQAPPAAEVNPTETSPVLESPRSRYTASGELKSPQLRAAEITGANRSNRASVMAQKLHEHGIPLSDAKNITTEQWKELSKSTGGKDPKGPSPDTVEATLIELGRLGRTRQAVQQ